MLKHEVTQNLFLVTKGQLECLCEIVETYYARTRTGITKDSVIDFMRDKAIKDFIRSADYEDEFGVIAEVPRNDHRTTIESIDEIDKALKQLTDYIADDTSTEVQEFGWLEDPLN